MDSEIKHRMTRRREDWDYCQRAIYSVTITLADRSRPWLGRLEVLAKNGEPRNCADAGNCCADAGSCCADAGSCCAEAGSCCAEAGSCCADAGRVEGAQIIPTPFGEAVVEALKMMPRLYPQVRIIEWQVMPDHFHFIVFVTSRLPKPLGELVRGLKGGATKRWKEISGTPSQECEGAERVAQASTAQFPEWTEGFQDTIIFRERQLAAEIAYLHDNPRRLAEKRANPDLFRRVASVSLPLDGGRLVGRFESLGNLNLLRRPLVQVQCSRRHFAYRRVPKPGGGLKISRHGATGEPDIANVSEEYEAIKEKILAAASHGAVVISPCISDGERQIAREAMNSGCRLVAMRNMGFSPLQKPVGRMFDMCAGGRLLLLAPAAWPYSTREKPMTRLDATALNRICQWLADDGDECSPKMASHVTEINYHGMTPLNIDRLAMEAVMAKELR